MDIRRIQHLIPTPRRNPKAIHPRSRNFIHRRDKRSWQAALRFGPLALIAIVQANFRLYEPTNKRTLPAVILYTTDAARRLDGQFLHAVVDQVGQVKRSPYLPDPELQRVQQLLVDEHSYFHLILPLKLSWGVPTVMCVDFLRPKLLPGGCIPPDRLLPAVIGEGEVYLVSASAYHR
jgi:hypothetical protein